MIANVLLVDDHPIVRQGLSTLLQNEPDIRVVGEAATGQEALDLVDQLKPDVLILDIMMPGLSGLEVTRQVLKRSPKIRVIILSMQSADAYVVEAMKNGAAGYVLKDTGPGELVHAVREVIQGRQYISPKLAGRLVPEGGGQAVADPYETLTARERETLQLTAEGLTCQQIGKKLGISPRTVEVHRSHMMEKLGLHNQGEVLHYALQRGILIWDN